MRLLTKSMLSKLKMFIFIECFIKKERLHASCVHAVFKLFIVQFLIHGENIFKINSREKKEKDSCLCRNSVTKY